jgi:hypothetical protein
MRERFVFTVMLGLAAATSGGCHPLTAPGTGVASDAGTQACGATTCTDGTVCCNASCGICTPPGRVCIQIACDPATVGKSCTDLSCAASDTCMETRSGPQCISPEENPCNLADCAPGSTCQVLGGAATCVPLQGQPVIDAALGSCAVADCAGTCRDLPDGGFVCEPISDASAPTKDAGPVVTPGTCALVLCAGICRDVPLRAARGAVHPRALPTAAELRAGRTGRKGPVRDGEVRGRYALRSQAGAVRQGAMPTHCRVRP